VKSIKATNLSKIDYILEFRKQDDDKNRPANEVLKSVMLRPANSTGAFRTIEFSWEEQRGALHAIERFALGGDVITDNAHLYHRSNPNRVGGAIGYLRANRIGTAAGISQRININGRTVLATLPSWRIEGRAVPHITTAWLKIIDLGDRVELQNCPIDPKSGKSNHDILHGYLQDLAEGTQLTVAVTLNWYVDKNTGVGKWISDLQEEALWFEGLMNGDLAEAVLKYEEKRRNAAVTFSTLRSNLAQGVITAEEISQDKEYVLTTRKGEEPAPEVAAAVNNLYVWVDGVKTPIAQVAEGKYVVVRVNDKGKEIGVVNNYFPVGKTTPSLNNLRALAHKPTQGLKTLSK
jgi:hypothetical protein